MVTGLPSTLDVDLDGEVDLGQRAAGELDVDHGAGDGDDAAVLERCSVAAGRGVLGDGHRFSPWVCAGAAAVRQSGVAAMGQCRTAVVGAVEVLGEEVLGLQEARHQVLLGPLVGAQRLGAADDLHDLGGDGVLAGPVHDAAERGLELFGVVGGGLHGPLAGGVLRGRGVEEGRVDAALDVAGQQLVEDARWATARTRGRPTGRSSRRRRRGPRSAAAGSGGRPPPGCRR